MLKEIYLDNSATTRPYDEVIRLMGEVSGSTYGNPSSLHSKGMEAEKRVRKARESIARCLEADAKEVVFTSGGTESNNLAIRGYLEANPRKGRHLITTQIEHPSVLEVFKYLQGQGFHTDFLSVDEHGQINPEDLRSKIREDTVLISLILVNNETGSLQPLETVVAARNQINRQTVIHVDAVQAFGKVAFLPKKLGVELASVSSHKIHGPKGAGALFVDKSIRLKPILLGGGQESLLRSGTENVPGICGFGSAADRVFENFRKNRERVEGLKRLLAEGLQRGNYDARILSPEVSSPYILNATFPGTKAEVLLHHLEEKGIFVSTGSACSSRKNVRSHVLTAMGLSPEIIDGAIRFSFSGDNTLDQIEETLHALEEIVPKIRIKRGSCKV